MPNDAKLLLQTWIKGEGNVHLRSPSLTEAEAVAVMSEIRSRKDEREIPFQDDQFLRINLDESPGTAWLLPSKGDDPDTPGRAARRLLVLYSPDPSHPTKEAAEETLKAVEFPTSLSGESWIPFTPFATQPTGQDHAKRPSKRLPRRVASGIAMALCLAAVAGAYYYNFGGSSHDRVEEPGASFIAPFERTTKSTKSESSETESETGAGGATYLTREEREWQFIGQVLRGLLNQEWAKEIRGDAKAPCVQEGETLLKAFVELFEMPNLDDVENLESFCRYVCDESEARKNPFTAFFRRFPESTDACDPKENVSAHDAASPKLDGGLGLEGFKALIKTLNANGLGLSDEPNKIAETARLALDYKAFYTKWNDKHEGIELDMYCTGEEKRQGSQWISGVREILEARYRLPPRKPNE